MLSFFSGSARDVNSDRAVESCLKQAFAGNLPTGACIIVVNCTMGHKLGRVYEAVHKRIPQAQVLGCTGMAVVGKDGAGESMNEVALMAIVGPAEECEWACVEGITAQNANEKGKALATALQEKMPKPQFVYLLTPGTDTDHYQLLTGVAGILGKEVLVFGGVASDSGKAVVTYQSCNDTVNEHSAFIIGFADPSLKAISRATHGFVAYGNPLTVTKSDGNQILELDGGPAWPTYLSHITADPTTDMNAALSFGAIGEAIPPELVEEYGNPHILRLAKTRDNQTMEYPTSIPEGTQIWYTARDEERIFADMEIVLKRMKEQMGDGKPVAVFQTDCLARGRLLLNRVSKDELLGMLYAAFSSDGQKPAWLGNYGLGEYARLGDEDVFHNYTTAMMVLYRDA